MLRYFFLLAAFFSLLHQRLLIVAQSADRDSRDTEKVGIIESVAKIAALLLPAQTAKKTANGEDEVTYGGNTEYPRCPSTCLAAWVGDAWCDSECALAECGNDGGDCEGWCAPDCKPGWVGDGNCDIDCFRKECEWDKNDCAGNYTREQLQLPLPKHKKFDYSKCPESCNRKFLHDKQCDQQCNIPECNFDGEDCYHQCAANCANAWLGDGDCDYTCNVAACGFDKGDCKICTEGCDPFQVGNGICDTVCDVESCDTDAGDCFGVCWVAEQIDYRTEPFFYPHCRTEWKGDGYCDCFCMNEGCEFDHGDCDGYDCTEDLALLRALNKRMNVTDEVWMFATNTSRSTMARRR